MENDQQPTPLRVPSAQEVLADLQKEQSNSAIPVQQPPIAQIVQQPITPRTEPVNQMPTILPAMSEQAAQLMSQSDKERLRNQAQHTKKMIVIGIILAISAIISFMVIRSYLGGQESSVVTPTQQTGTTDSQDDLAETQAEAAEYAVGTEDSTQTPSQTTNPGTSTATTPASQAPCGVAAIPQGACTAILSLERQGLKNNPHVNADTSQIPDGGALAINKQSWASSNSESGAVQFTATYAGETHQGTGYLQVINGIWKVVNYTLQ